jgi:hypothetical protein
MLLPKPDLDHYLPIAAGFSANAFWAQLKAKSAASALRAVTINFISTTHYDVST